MPLWGKPMISHALEFLAGWGAREVLINLHHRPEPIMRHVLSAKPAKMKICFSYEPEIMGTGGALRRAQWFLDTPSFWMMNADVACDASPRPLLEAFSGGRFISALLLNDREGPRTVEMTDGKIRSFRSLQPGGRDTYTFCGIQLLSSEILRFIPEQGFSTIIDAYERCMSRGRKIAGVCPDRMFWADIGTLDNYLGAHAAVYERFLTNQSGRGLFDPAQMDQMSSLRKKGIHLSGFLSVGSGVSIGKGAHIANSVVWNDARIGGSAILENAVVSEKTRVKGRVPRVAMRSSETSDAAIAIAVRKLGWDASAVTVIPLEPRGSDRNFSRLEHKGDTVIVICHSPEREENALYADHARFLKQIMAWPVPTVILDVPRQRLSIMQDLGDISLQSIAETMPLAKISRIYQLVIDAARKLHTDGAGKARRARLRLSSPFSPELYLWERNFFARHFLGQHLNMPEQKRTTILAELAQVALLLQRERMVLIHRDLQSSNILMVKGLPYFIDFQGMRMGPAAYDLASLLCDPYVELPLRLQKQLLRSYNEGMPRKARVDENVFWLAAIERLAQALGAYAKLSASPDTARFRKYIMPGSRMMLLALQQSGMCPTLTALMRNTLNDGADIRAQRSPSPPQLTYSSGTALGNINGSPETRT